MIELPFGGKGTWLQAATRKINPISMICLPENIKHLLLLEKDSVPGSFFNGFINLIQRNIIAWSF